MVAPLERVPGVEVFATGEYPQGRYTLNDLTRIVLNSKKIGRSGLRLHSASVGMVPKADVGIGHERDDAVTKAYLGRTDIPSVGTVDPDSLKVVPYRVGNQWHGTLVGDLVDLIPEVANDIRSRRYRSVSAEIYDNFRDDFGNTHGMALKRVSLLGHEPPAVKRLKDLPMPVRQFGEPAGDNPHRLSEYKCPKCGGIAYAGDPKTGAMFRGSGACPKCGARFSIVGLKLKPTRVFSEVRRLRVVSRIPSGLGRFLCFAEFQPMPMDISAVIAAVKKVVPDLADDKLAGLSELLAALGGESVPEMPEAPEMPEPAEAFGEADRAALIGELTGMGQDPTALAAMTDDELKSLKNTLATPAAPAPDAAMGEAKKMFAEAAKLLADVKAKAAVVSKFAEQAAKERRKDHVAGVVSELLKLGKVTPAEAPAVTDRLTRADAVKVFGEKGKQTTEFAAQVAELYARPVVVKFGEKLADNHPAIDNETAKAQQWADRNADALKRAGKSPAEYVKTFSEVLKANPQMTAAKFGVPA